MKSQEKNKVFDEIRKKVQQLTPDVIKWRRWFHQHPELAFEEKLTSQRIQQILKEKNIPFHLCGKTGLVAYLRGDKPGVCLGLRADMDALPISEETNLPFASVYPGRMHACGHDAHMATALGVVAVLVHYRKFLPGTIKFIFQPAEEKPPGGAREILTSGLIDEIKGLIGFHYFSNLPKGKYWIGEGSILAATDQFSIRVSGRGGHASAPHLTSDPIVAASFIINQTQTIVSRRVDPLQSAVVSFGSIHGGDAFNIIPSSVHLQGTVRTLEEETRKLVVTALRKICRSVQCFDCRAKLDFQSYCPATKNDVVLAKKVKLLSEKILKKNALVQYHPLMGGEDFAFYSQKIPSCYVFAGIGRHCGNNHSSTFNLDESVLPGTTCYLSCLLWQLAMETSQMGSR